MHWPNEVAKAKEEKAAEIEGEICAPNVKHFAKSLQKASAATACSCRRESKSLFLSFQWLYLIGKWPNNTF